MTRFGRLRWTGPTALLFLASDAIALAGIALVTVHVRYQLQGQFSYSLYLNLWPLLFLFLLTYASLGLYPGVLLSPPEELKKTFWGTTLVFLALAVGTFLSKGGELYSRAIYLGAWGLTATAVPLSRTIVRFLFASKTWWGYPVVLFCDETQASQQAASVVVSNLKYRPHSGLKPLVVVRADDPEVIPQNLNGTPVISLSKFFQTTGDFQAEYAIVAMPQCDKGRLDALLSRLSRHFRSIVLIPDLAIRSSLWAKSLDFFGVLGLQLEHKLLDPRRMALKRILDLCAAVVLGILLMPLFAVFVVLIRLESPGPATYGHQRIGRNGKPITILKFRTMVKNADERLCSYLEGQPDLRAEWEACHKLKNDPRITRVGHFLRKWSLDELPQLWNVIRGDLSLVGPRPIVRDEIRLYEEHFEEYTRVLPGMTGLWQVSGRSETSYDERINLDMYYIRNWSIWMDIYIVLKTLPVILAGRGY